MVVCVVFVVGAIFVYSYLDTVPVTLSTEDVSSVEISSQNSPISTTQDSDKYTFRATKNSTISVKFVGVSGFAGGSKEFNIGTDPKTIKIQPYYSKSRLSDLLTDEIPLIARTIQSKIVGVSKYKITNPVLYHYGGWASIQLEKKGAYSLNSDTQSVILSKSSSGSWRIQAGPDILFFYRNYPSVPVDILEQVNNL